MHALKKTIALSLSLLMVSQSVVFAQTEAQDSLTLSQYQQKVRQEMQDTPWIAREGKYILGAGTVGALLIGQHILYKRKISLLRKQQLQKITDIRSFYYGELATRENLRLENATLRLKKSSLEWDHFFLQDEIEALQAALNNLHAENQYLKNQTEGLTAARNIQAKRIEELEKTINSLEKRLGKNAFIAKMALPADIALEEEMAKYHRLFDTATSGEERQALLRSLANEPWLKKWPQEQQKEFMNIIRQSSLAVRAERKGILSGAAKRYFSEVAITKSYYPRLAALAKGLFKSPTLGVIGFGFAFSLFTQNTQAQTQAKRINENMELFLSATPEQLAQLEKNEETREACITAAQTVHLLSQLSLEEAEPYMQTMKQQDRAARITHPQRHISAH